MGVVKTILLVAFVIVCVLLVLLVLVQNEESNGMGTAFGGQSAAFGAKQGTVLTRTTGVLTALFFIVAFSLSLLNKAPSREDLSATAERVQGVETSETTETGSWLENEVNSQE